MKKTFLVVNTGLINPGPERNNLEKRTSQNKVQLPLFKVDLNFDSAGVVGLMLEHLLWISMVNCRS